MRKLIITLALFSSEACFAQWQVQANRTQADLRGLSTVGNAVVWASGSKGVVERSIDGGKNWHVLKVMDSETLDFRDIEAFSDTTAYILSIGPGNKSRIYKTVDGGNKWKLQFSSTSPDAFYDAIAFWDENHGIALSDPVNGHFQLIATEDGGGTWKLLPTANMPAIQAREGAFAASGTCLVTQGKNDVWFVTGGARVARVFHSNNRGQSWTATDTPILAGKESAGIFSIAFKVAMNGIVVGGDYQKPAERVGTIAITTDGGITWKAIGQQLPFRSCVAWAKDHWVAVGTTGSDASYDHGLTWKHLSNDNFNTVSFSKDGTGWAVGPKGKIAKWSK